MNDLGKLKKDLVSLLKGNTAFANIKVTEEYPKVRDYPLRRPVISVGLDSADMTSNIGKYLGYGIDGGEMQGSTCMITLRFDLFCRDDGTDPHEIMEKLCGVLLFESGCSFTKLGCSEVQWDKDMGAVKLTVRGSFFAALTAGLLESGEFAKEVDIALAVNN